MLFVQTLAPFAAAFIFLMRAALALADRRAFAASARAHDGQRLPVNTCFLSQTL